MNENRKLKSSLHTHVRSVDDGDITAEELSDEIIALGGTSCAITDHGSVAAIEDYRRVFEKKGLKLIPGCELYVEGGIFGRRHLIVLAKNDNGWKGIGKIVTAANLNIEKGYPVITIAALNKVMKSYKGDIIALSACMQGVVCSCFLMNRTVNEKINSLRYRQMKHISPSSNEYSDAEEVSRDAERQLEELTITRDRLKEIAEQKFKKRETYAKKLEKTDPEGAKREYEKIASDKEEAERAEAQLVIIKSDLTGAKKAASEAARALKEVSLSIDKWLKIEGEINELSKNLVSEEEMEKNAETNTQTMLKIFGKDCFFMEMQYHGIKEERECFPKAAKIAHKFGIPLVATNDVHILRNTEDDRLKRQILRSMRFKKWANEEPGDKELYLKTDEELSEWLSKILPPEDVKEAIDNIGVVADLCNVEFKTGKHYPKFGAEDSNKLLEAEIEKGIKWRFPGGMDEAHKERLKKELPIIESMGYSDYHLIVKDFLEYGRLLGYLPKEKIADAPITIPELESYIQENGWHNMGLMTGPGRGSAVGSLVCYLLGITTLDPLKYNLLFERFLNPERISMPDIDSDFANTIRPKVIQYVQNKYGYNAVCGILTVIKLQPKGAINTAAKYYGLKKNGEGMLSLGDKLSSDVPNALNIAFSTKVDKNGAVDEDGESDYTLYQFLKDKYDGNEDALEILRWAKILEGTVSGFSAHAAGIVISDNDDVSEYLPLRMNEKLGMLTTQCDMVELEDNGLLKFDFLGLKTLDIITETLKAIEETTGIIIDPLTIDLTDKSVYEDIFQKGKTNSVFQFSSQGMKAMLKRFKPQSFEDLIILNSMFRPGPLQYLDGVCNVKNGVEEAEYLCPELEPILSKTYAAIVYQEQVMEIFQKLAGYSLGGADQVRRYMSKKKADKLALEREAFINGDPKRGIKGCVANGISKEVADKLFDQMSEFAKYAFNKSHAAAYSYNAYITAWLKKHYPREFFSCALDWAENLDEVSEIIKEAESFGIKIYAPDINLSTKGFSVTDDGIRFGLSSVAGVKDHSNAIIEERNKNGGFRSLGDFSVRCNENKKVVKNLIDSGAFDSLSELNRAQLGTIAEKIPDLVKKRREKADLIKAAAIVSSKIETATSEELIKLQEESGIRVMFEKPCKRATFDKKVADSKKAIEELDAAINNIAAPGLHEDPAEKLAKEHELLGAYVSGNPLDLYPSAKDLGFPDLCDVAEGGSKAYGIVSSLNIKKRKSDGAPMAFFKLEDRTGSIDVCCFTKAYASYGKMLEEGSVVMLTGDINAEVSDDDEEKLKFILKTAVKAERKVTSVFVLQVSGLDAFHEKEEGLSKRYGATENGIPLRVFNESDGLFYQTKLTVSDRILELPSVRRMKTGS